MPPAYDRDAAQALFEKKIPSESRIPTLPDRGLGLVVAQNVISPVTSILLLGVVESYRDAAGDRVAPGRLSLSFLFDELVVSIALAGAALVCAAQARRHRVWALRVTELIVLWRAWTPLPSTQILSSYYFAELGSGRWPTMVPFTVRTFGAFLFWSIGGVIALLLLESRESRQWFRAKQDPR